MNINKKTPKTISKTAKTISNKEKITMFVDTINYLNKYGEKVKNIIIQKDETNITAYEGKLMFVIKALLETLMAEYGIEVSHESGAVLNLSIRLLQHIRDNKLELVFNEETKEISASIGRHLQPQYAFLKLNKGKNSLGKDSLQFLLYKSPTEIFCHTEESIKGCLTDRYIEGKCYDGRTKHTNEFSIKFYENGLLNQCNYSHEIYASELKNHKLFLLSEKLYGRDDYFENTFVKQSNNNEEKREIIYESYLKEYMGPLERIIVDIPGFIPIARVNDELSIINFKNDCIKDVYPGIYSAAEIIDNKVKKHIR